MITREGAAALAWLMYFSQMPMFREATEREQRREPVDRAA